MIELSAARDVCTPMWSESCWWRKHEIRSDRKAAAAFQATGNAIGSMIFIVMTVTIITLQKGEHFASLGRN